MKSKTVETKNYKRKNKQKRKQKKTKTSKTQIAKSIQNKNDFSLSSSTEKYSQIRRL